MRRRIDSDAEATAPLRTFEVLCVACGCPFVFRETRGGGRHSPGPIAFIEWLCHACFDAWCWDHPPVPPPEGGHTDAPIPLR